MSQALIVAAQLSPGDQRLLDALREAYFPPSRNYLTAHLTLFHALPDTEENAIHQALVAATEGRACLTAILGPLMLLGGGVAFEVKSAALIAIHRGLQKQFSTFLTRQDAGGLRPHVTVQNKVSKEEAKRLFRELQATHVPKLTSIDSLSLFRYQGGPWDHLNTYKFGG